MSEAKPSGIRPPSKIGRPCCTMPPRPAVPTLPTRPPANPMDHLWESQGRRLSEAGLRRGSDTSVVLTEDTDSFIIGDRVWVGGTKPGSIAYIGETQFAPGDWAGVVLDEPIGKNDGSVAGCRYFQCEPKRGIFSRLTKLSRQPLDLSSAAVPSSPLAQKTPTSPPDSARGSLNKSMSPSLNASTTSLSSTMSQRDLRIGERVIVSSSQGSKTGVLRYIGAADFHSGEWCGVELDEPIGKNDGSVEGKRYFECPPKHGLFAPLHKVTRSPSSKRTSCVVHKPTGASLNSTLKRSGSRESLISTSSIASTTAASRSGYGSTTRRPGMRISTPARSSLQDILKEKQQEIDALRKERDLERERVTKAASQADHAEQSAISMKQEYDKYRVEMQKTIQNAEAALTKLLGEKNVLALQLDEERRRCEDLLFRFEEETVNKDDIRKDHIERSVLNTVNENKIKKLEKQLTEERERVIQLERDSIKLFETEEELTRLRNETCNLSSQDKNEFKALETENQNLRELKISLEQQVLDGTAQLVQDARHVKELEDKLKDTEQHNNMYKEMETKLQKQLTEANNSLLEKTALVESLKQDQIKHIETLQEELQKARAEVNNITNTNTNENILLGQKYQKLVEETDNILKIKTQEYESEAKKQVELQNIALETIKAENVKQLHELSESFKEELNTKNTRIKEISSQLSEKVSETEQLLNAASTQQILFEQKNSELKMALQEVEELSLKLQSVEASNTELASKLQGLQSKAEETMKIIQEKQKLEQDVASLHVSTSNSTAQLNKLKEELKEKDKELEELRSITAAQLEELTRNFQQQVDSKSKYIEEMSSDISHKSLVLNMLEEEVQELKVIIIRKDEEIKVLLEKTSELQYALTLSEQTKTNLESELKVFESNVENLTQQIARADEKISQVTAQKQKLELDIASLVSTSTDSSEQLVKYNEDLRTKEKELDEFRDKIFQTENMLSVTVGKLKTKEQELNTTGSLMQQLQREIENYKEQVDKKEKLNVEHSEKIQQFVAREKELIRTIDKIKQTQKDLDQQNEIIQELKEKVKKADESLLLLQTEYDALNSRYIEELPSLRKQINDLTGELSNSREEVKMLQKQKTKLESDQSANRWTIEEVTEKLDSEVQEKLQLQSLLSEANSELQKLTAEHLELQKDENSVLTEKEAVVKKYEESLNKMSAETEDLQKKLNVAAEIVKEKEQLIGRMKELAQQTETQLSELNNNMTTLTKLQDETNNKLKSTQESLLIKQEEIQKLTEEKKSSEINMETLEVQLKTQKSDLERKDDMLKNMEEKMKKLQKSEEERLKLLDLQNILKGEMKIKESELEVNTNRNRELEELKIKLQDIINTNSVVIDTKEAIISDLETQLKTVQGTQVEKIKANQQSKNEELKLMQNKIDEVHNQNKTLVQTKDYLEKLVKEQQIKVDILTSTMKNKEKESEKNVQNLIERINIPTAESTQPKESIQTHLENEEKQMPVRWTEATHELKFSHENIKNNCDTASGDMKQHIVKTTDDYAKLQEENETVKSQIDFLNSVIVDMQRKNEALLCKVEVLEMGVPPSEADDYSRSTLDKRMAAPRMFCDICDRFDLHETEDCPRQAQDVSEINRSKSPKKQSMERPYCENCEIFGHDTHDCDDTETF